MSTVNRNKNPMYLNKIIVWFAYMQNIGTANMQCQAKLQKACCILKQVH